MMCTCAYGDPANMLYAPVGLCVIGSPVAFGSNGHIFIQCGPEVSFKQPSIVPNGRRTERRKFGHVPASSQCLDQEHTRVQPAPQDINGVSLIGELDRLRGDDLEVRVDSSFVTYCKMFNR